MKCPHCGSNLTIDDERCLFCGQDNPYAVKHRRELRRFSSDFRRTKEKALDESRRVNFWAVKITLIAVLVALNALMLFVNMESYYVYRFFEKRQIEADYSLHKENLDKYEKENNFIAFAKYYEFHNLYYGETFEDYARVYNVCNNYSDVYEYILAMETQDPEYYDLNSYLKFIAELMGYMYNNSVPGEYADPKQYEPQHQECMDAAVETAEDLIQTYFNLTDEERESFAEISSARRQILMEEGSTRNE